jgi:hypothetical protein
MKRCEQAPGLNMLQHGEKVHQEYNALMESLSLGNECEELQAILLKFGGNLPPSEVLKQYHVYHDCGKHLCLTITEDGKRHFPNHAAISANQYAVVFPEDKFTSILIAHDMDFHICKGDELMRVISNPIAPILYFTAWAEINANASMFGGKSSESYKIKRSRLIQAGKKLLKSKE